MSLLAEVAAAFRDLPGACRDAGRDLADAIVNIFADDDPTGGA